jgi:hypothetical protein
MGMPEPPGAMDPNDLVTVTVSLAKLRSPALPQICVKTGMKAQCLVRTVATTTPRWAWVLILLGGWPLFAARKWLFPREELALPTRTFVAARYEWAQKGLIGCFTVVGVILVAGVATLSPAGIVGAWLLAVVVTGIWLLLVPRYWVTAELGGSRVRLGAIHRVAATAIERA